MSNQRHIIHFGLLTFALAILAGATQYIATIALEHILPKALFSQVSLILGYFASYMLLLELGIQEELVRRLQLGEIGVQSAVLKIRIIGALIAFTSILLNSYFTGVSSEVFWGTLSFALCFFPAAFLFTNEANGYVSRRTFAAGGQRLARGLVMLVLTATLVFIQPLALSKGEFFAAFSLFPLVFSFMAFLSWRSAPFASGVSSVTIAVILRDSWHLIVSRFVQWAFAGLFLHYCISYAGETHVSELTISLVLTVPVGILLQVYSQLYFAQNGSTPTINRTGVSLAVLLVALLYGCLISLPWVHRITFSNLNYDQTMMFFWPNLLAVIISAGNQILLIDAPKTSRRQAALVSPIASIVTLLILIHFVLSHLDFSFIAFGWLAAVVVGAFTTIFTIRGYNLEASS